MKSITSSKDVSKRTGMKHFVSPKILCIFSDLAQKDADKRAKAVLLLNQVTLPEASKDLDDLTSTANYCLTRLVRGLASSRTGAREGFFIGLVHFMRRLPRVSTATLLSVADAELPEVGDPRQATEHRIGRLLAAGAAVRTCRYSDGDSGELRRLTCALLANWQHRAYMPPMVATFLVELLTRVSEEQFRAAMWPELSLLLANGWDGCIPERFWLLVVCRRQFPNVIDSHFLKQHWGSRKILSSRNYAGIAAMIKVCAGSLPVIHPLVAALAELAVTRPAAELHELRSTVLESLLADRASAALLVMALVQSMMPHINTPELVSSLLSPTLVEALVQLLPKRDQRTEQAARGLGSALVSRVLAPDSSAELQLAIIHRLVSPPGSINFDHMTGTKILAQMLNGLNTEALEPFSKIALDAFMGSQTDQNLTPRARAVACDILCRLVQHPSTPQRTPLKESLLERLFIAGVVQDSAVSDELAATALRAFFRALDHPVRHLSDLTALLRALTAHQDRLLRDRRVSLRTPLSVEARAAWDSAAAALRQLPPDSGPDTDLFVILLGHLSQQLFSADCSTAIDALRELHTCLKRQQERPSCAPQPHREDGEPAWSEVVVDLLLSLLALNVHLLRSVVRSVFTLLAPTLSPQAVMHVFQSLDPQFSMNGTLADESDDGLSEDESAEEGEEEASEDEWEDESSDAEGDCSSAEEGEEDQLETMRTQVKAALGDDSDDATSLDMDEVPEEHFARVDEALAAAFNAMRKDKRMKRGGQTDREQALMHFRIRVLDLADVYIRVCPRSVAALSLLPPLVSLLSTCAADARQAPLLSRLRTCLTRLTAAGGRLPDQHGLTVSLLAELLQDVLTSGARLPAFSLELGGLLVAAVRLLVRTSALLNSDQTPVLDALKAALNAFFTDRACVYPARLFSQLLALPTWPRGWALVTPLLEAAFAPQVRLYRCTQALQLATTAVRNGALLQSAPSTELKSAAAQLQNGVHKVVSDGASANGVRTKYLSSALEALLALKQTARRLGLPLPRPAVPLDSALAQLSQRVALGRHIRRLITQLCGDTQRSPPVDTIRSNAAVLAEPAASAGRRRRERPGGRRPGSLAPAQERGDSVDSGVAEVASDAEPPLRKKKRRSDSGGASL